MCSPLLTGVVIVRTCHKMCNLAEKGDSKVIFINIDTALSSTGDAMLQVEKMLV